MEEQFSRSALIFGENSIKKLSHCRVAVFGIGGVGGYAVEALARGGIGALDLIDSDVVSESNINRQLVALHSTIGEYKVDVAKKRLLDINPNCIVNTYKTFFTPENAEEFDFKNYDYIVDAIDTVTSKIALVESAKKYNVPIICAMGAGNKTDPTAFKVADISKTKVCPLAKVMRIELRKRGINHVKTVYSEELPYTCSQLSITDTSAKRSVPGSTSFVPSVAGLIIAGEVIKDLVNLS